MKIVSAGQEETRAYTKRYRIEEGGINYAVVVSWNEYYGYETYWYEGNNIVPTPQSIQEAADREEIPVGWLIELEEEKANA